MESLVMEEVEMEVMETWMIRRIKTQNNTIEE
jgi:hypothetical protein